MRVITGTARGARLKTLPSNDVRPTPEKVKEAIFSAIQFDIDGRRFLDLFAGCGQMGIEALSRGAQSCVFVDNTGVHLNVVKDNLKTADLEDKARVVCADYASFLATTPETFDIAFLDPPYHAGMLEKALNKVTCVMSEYGIILCEHPSEVALPEKAGDFTCYKVYSYGKIRISAYRRAENE